MIDLQRSPNLVIFASPIIQTQCAMRLQLQVKTYFDFKRWNNQYHKILLYHIHYSFPIYKNLKITICIQVYILIMTYRATTIFNIGHVFSKKIRERDVAN